MSSDEWPARPLVEYSVGAVARRLGIPVATLRSWNQRYGLGPSQSYRGRHRRYTPTDFAVAVRMVELVRAGASPASAAVAALTVAVPVPQVGDLAPVISAVERLDAAELVAMITAHLTHHGVVATWNRLCRPIFAEIVGKQTGGAGFVDVEHLLSWAVTTSLHRVIPLLRNMSGGLPIVLACTDGEDHVLPLEVLRAALAELGMPALLLGASVPIAAVVDALAKHDRRPIVVLWSQSSRTAIPVPTFGPREGWARVLLAGPGWRDCALPSGAAHVDTLEAAIAELQFAIAANLR